MNGGVGQRVAFALRASSQQHCAEAGTQPHAYGRNVAGYVLHRVVDREPGVHVSAGRVDVQADVAVRILAGQVQELRDDRVRHLGVDGRAQEHDPLLEEQRVDIECAFPSRTRLHHHRDDVFGPLYRAAWAVEHPSRLSTDRRLRVRQPCLPVHLLPSRRLCQRCHLRAWRRRHHGGPAPPCSPSRAAG